MKIFKKNFKNSLPVKKRSCTFAPALRNTLTSVMISKETEIKFSLKQEEHVPRHIELTAVLREILRQKNKE